MKCVYKTTVRCIASGLSLVFSLVGLTDRRNDQPFPAEAAATMEQKARSSRLAIFLAGQPKGSQTGQCNTRAAWEGQRPQSSFTSRVDRSALATADLSNLS